MSYTVEVYTKLSDAYDHFNKELFDGTLPSCIITLAHKRNAYGYFRSQPFAQRTPSLVEDNLPVGSVDEIALNPWAFPGRTDREILSTLVHEMVHLWEHHFATPPKRPVHTKVWAERMDLVGLTPTSTGEAGGKRTGRNVTHMIVDGGPFDRAYKQLEISIDWLALAQERKKKERKPKCTYKCQSCEGSVRGTVGMTLMCVDCDSELEAQ